MKRIISLLCAVVMILSSFSVIAADEVENEVITNPALEEMGITGIGGRFVMPDEGTLSIEGEELTDYDTTMYTAVSSTTGSGKKVLSYTGGGSTLSDLAAAGIDKYTGYEVKFEVELNKIGEYAIWLRVPYGTSFYYARDNGALARISGNTDYIKDGWCWKKCGFFNVVEPRVASMRLAHRFTSFKVDRIIITNDHAFEPVEADAYPTGDTTAWWELPKVTPPEGHPRIEIHPDNHQKIIERSKTERYKSIAPSLKKSGDTVTWEAVTRKGAGDFTGPTDALADRARYYLLNPDDKEYAKETIALARQWFTTADVTEATRGVSTSTRSIGAQLRNLAIVYDYCYDQLTDEDKEIFVARFKRFLAFFECGYPFGRGQHTIFAHTGEYMIFRDALVVGMAIYDEDPAPWNVYAGVFFNYMAPGRHWGLSSGAHLSGVQYGDGIRAEGEMYAQRLFKPWGLSDDDLFSEHWKDAMVRFLYITLPSGEGIQEGEKSVRVDADSWREIGIHISTIPYLWPEYENNTYIQARRRMMALENGANDVTRGSWTEMLLWDPEDPNSDNVFDFGNDMPLGLMGRFPFTYALIRNSWDLGEDSPAVVASFNMREYIVELHYECFVGSFQLYYKGWLAPSTDAFTSQSGWAGANNRNYSRASIAHNTMAIVDPEEVFLWNYQGSTAAYVLGNSGGQDPDVYVESRRARKLENVIGENPVTTQKAVVDGKFMGPNKKTPKFTYIKGDMAGAYAGRRVHKDDGRTIGQYLMDEYGIDVSKPESKNVPGKFNAIYENEFVLVPKVSESKRGMVYINLNNNDYPAAFVCFDKVVATDPTFDKNWVIHSVDGMELNGNVLTLTNTYKHSTGRQNNGKLVNYIMLPENPEVEIIGGPGKEAMSGGVNWYGSHNSSKGHTSFWRAEVSPSKDEEETVFLNAMYFTDYDRNLPPLPMYKEQSATHLGVTVMDSVVMFANDGYIVEAPFTLDIRDNNNGGEMSCMIGDVAAGKWQVTGGGRKRIIEVTEEEHTLYFEGLPGSYSIIPATSSAEVDVIEYEELPVKPVGDIVIWDATMKLFRYNPVPPRIIDETPYVGAKGFYEYYDGHEVKDNGDGSWTISFHKYASTAEGKGMHKSTTIWPDSTRCIVNGVETTTKSTPKLIDGVLYVNPVDYPDSSPLIVTWKPKLCGLYVINNVDLAFLYEDLGGDFSKICKATVSKYSSHISGAPANLYDNKFGSKWATLGENWVTLKLEEPTDLRSFYISVYGGDERTNKFAVDVSSDNSEWKEVFNGETSGTTDTFERFLIEGADDVAYVRLRVFGNNENGYNNISEFWVEAK